MDKAGDVAGLVAVHTDLDARRYLWCQEKSRCLFESKEKDFHKSLGTNQIKIAERMVTGLPSGLAVDLGFGRFPPVSDVARRMGLGVTELSESS